MFIIPRRFKHQKWHKGTKGPKLVESTLRWGSYGLRVVEPARINASQLEACRRRIRRHIPRSARLYIRAFTDRPVTGKSTGVRMGKGKGAVKYWATYIQPGSILFEIEGATFAQSEKALKTAAAKIPMLTRIIKRRLPLL